MPENRDIFAGAMSQAESLRWENGWVDAARQYERALGEFPDDPAARSGLAFCLMQDGQYERALAEYGRVLAQDRESVLALTKIAELYGLLERWRDAFLAYLRLGDFYAQASQGARAEAAWQKAVSLAPDEPEPYERLALHFRSKKDLPSALGAHLAAARIYARRGEQARARQHAEEVVRADPGNQQARVLLAEVGAGSAGGRAGQQQIRETPAAYEVAGGEEQENERIPLWTGPLARLQGSSAISASMNPSAVTPGMASPAAQTSAARPEAFESENTGRTGTSMAKKGTPPAQGGPKGGANAGRGGQAEQNGRKRMTAQQVASALRQAQAAQTEGRIAEAIDLCEQIIDSGFDRPDARYFLGWLYQEQERWEDAIGQFNELLNDPDYALSCFYALGQCFRAMGDLAAAAQHFDEAVDRVNLDALTLEESDQLMQLCHEAAEAHRALGELDQTETVYNALLGFLRSRGWQDQVAEVEQMMAEGEQAGGMPAQQELLEEPATVTFGGRGGPARQPMEEGSGGFFPLADEPPTVTIGGGDTAQRGRSTSNVTLDDDWLSAPAPASPVPNPMPAPPAAPPGVMAYPAYPPAAQMPGYPSAQGYQPAPAYQPQAPQQMSGALDALNALTRQGAPAPARPSVLETLAGASGPLGAIGPSAAYPAIPSGAAVAGTAADPLKALLGAAGVGSGALPGMATPGPAPTGLPPLAEPIRSQVVAGIRDIEKYVSHGLLTAAIDECLRVIEMVPQYLDVHLMLGEIYVKQGKIEQAITKYAILIDTYLVNGRVDDAIATYRRILQLEPQNLTYRVRLLNLLASHGRNDELLRERMTAGDAYLRQGYAEKAIQEYEQALQENPQHLPMRLNYALALMKGGRGAQAIGEYQRVLQMDPRNATALARWQMALATGVGASVTPGIVAAGAGANRVAALEMLGRLLKALRGDGQRYLEAVLREYVQALEAAPSNADLRYSLGQIQQQAGRFGEAQASYQQAMNGAGMEALCRVALARCWLSQAGPSNAMNAVRELDAAALAVRRAPVEPAVWAACPRDAQEEQRAPDIEISLLLATAYEQAGQPDRAQTIRQQVKQVLPTQEAVHASAPLTPAPAVKGNLQEFARLVQHYLANKQTEMAIDILKKMVAMAPQEPAPHGDLGEIYVSWGMLDEGLSELRQQVDLLLRSGKTPEAATVLQRIAAIYWDMGNQEEALSAFRQVVQLVPEDVAARMEMVQYCLQASRREEATFHQSVIARHYFASDQNKEAVAALQQLIAIDKTNFEAYDLLGQTYFKEQEYEQAQRVYRNLAKLDPDNRIAYERMQQLQELLARRR